MRMLLLVAAGAAVVTHQGEPKLSFTVGGNRFVVSNFDTGGLDGTRLGDKQKHFNVAGNLARVFSADMGFTASGKTMDFRITEADPKSVVVSNGLIEGTAAIIFDSWTAGEAAAQKAAKAGKPAPASSKESHHSEVHSEKIVYAGSADFGSLELPQSWTLTDTTIGAGTKEINGVQVPITTEQITQVTGISGQMKIGKDKTGRLGKLQSGVTEGPVHFTIVRKETPKGTSVASVSRYTGVADRVTIDATTTPGTLVAQGHVVVDADSPEIKDAHFVEDKVTIELDEQMQPLTIRFGGKPAKTSVSPRGGGK
jgi:hypothetical protein